MKERLLKSVAVSLEYRVFAFVVTELFLWATTGQFWQATILAFELQILLLIAHFSWYYIRESKSR